MLHQNTLLTKCIVPLLLFCQDLNQIGPVVLRPPKLFLLVKALAQNNVAFYFVTLKSITEIESNFNRYLLFFYI